MQGGGARGVPHPPKKTIWQKLRKKGKNHTIKKIYKKITMIVYKWVKSEEFSRGGGNPLTSTFFLNSHLSKINPAYAPVARCPCVKLQLQHDPVYMLLLIKLDYG